MPSSTPDDLGAEVEHTATGHLVRLRGELDLASAPELSTTLTDAAASDDGHPVVLDMSGVTFIDSSALRTLVATGRELAANGRVLQIGPRSDVVSRVLEMTRLDQSGDAFQVLPQDR